MNAGHAQDRGRPLGRGWRQVAQALQLQPGDTLILRRAAGPAGHGQAGAAGEPRALASVIRSSVPAPAAAAAGGASTAASPPAAGAGAAEGGGGGATPLAGRKRAADEAGLLLRSPGGTIRQLCVDKMLAAARAKQGREASPQQHQPAAQVQPQHVQVKQERRDLEGYGQRQQQQQQLHCVPAELQATQQTDRERVAQPAAPPQQQQPGQQQPLLPAPVGHGQNESGAGRRLGGGGGRLPAAPAALHGPAIMAPDVAAAAGEAAGAPAQPSPYELYSRMKPAVMACGLPGAGCSVLHVYINCDTGHSCHTSLPWVVRKSQARRGVPVRGSLGCRQSNLRLAPCTARPAGGQQPSLPACPAACSCLPSRLLPRLPAHGPLNPGALHGRPGGVVACAVVHQCAGGSTGVAACVDAR